MNTGENKKTLFLIGMDQSAEVFLKMENLSSENLIILKSYLPVISHPFDDLMRDILIAVYQESIEQIFVVASKHTNQKAGKLYNKIIESKGKEELKTLDYLFKNTMPEFPGNSIKEWCEGGKTVKDRVKTTVNIIRNHPLMPSAVKVKEMWIDEHREVQSETKAI